MPISDTWTRFPSDHLDMIDEVEVTAAGEARGGGKPPRKPAAGAPRSDHIRAEPKSDFP
jgi:hypothetical protein